MYKSINVLEKLFSLNVEVAAKHHVFSAENGICIHTSICVAIAVLLFVIIQELIMYLGCIHLHYVYNWRVCRKEAWVM